MVIAVVTSGSKNTAATRKSRETTKNRMMNATVLIAARQRACRAPSAHRSARYESAAQMGMISTSGGAAAANSSKCFASALELARLVAVVEVSTIMSICRPSGCINRPSLISTLYPSPAVRAERRERIRTLIPSGSRRVIPVVNEPCGSTSCR